MTNGLGASRLRVRVRARGGHTWAAQCVACRLRDLDAYHLRRTAFATEVEVCLSTDEPIVLQIRSVKVLNPA